MYRVEHVVYATYKTRIVTEHDSLIQIRIRGLSNLNDKIQHHSAKLSLQACHCVALARGDHIITVYSR